MTHSCVSSVHLNKGFRCVTHISHTLAWETNTVDFLGGDEGEFGRWPESKQEWCTYMCLKGPEGVFFQLVSNYKWGVITGRHFLQVRTVISWVSQLRSHEIFLSVLFCLCTCRWFEVGGLSGGKLMSCTFVHQSGSSNIRIKMRWYFVVVNWCQ